MWPYILRNYYRSDYRTTPHFPIWRLWRRRSVNAYYRSSHHLCFEKSAAGNYCYGDRRMWRTP